MLFAQEDRTKVRISTDLGDLVVALYNETPQHRDNFIKLVNEGFYDGTSFHRIIENFMIQGGDPNSKEGNTGVAGQGGPGYKVPAEINADLIHKKGALCAARQGDNMNPQRESSGSQFYIVQGATYGDDELKKFEKRIVQDVKNQALREFFNEPENKAYLDRLMICQQNKDQEEIKRVLEEVEPIIESQDGFEMFAYTDKQKAIYKTLGGTPYLDMQYTVFGEVVSGFDLIDVLASVPKEGESPNPPVRMRVSLVE